jgi:hypothetical protein
MDGSTSCPVGFCTGIFKLCTTFLTSSCKSAPVAVPFIGIKAASSSVILNSYLYHEWKQVVCCVTYFSVFINCFRKQITISGFNC